MKGGRKVRVRLRHINKYVTYSVYYFDTYGIPYVAKCNPGDRVRTRTETPSSTATCCQILKTDFEFKRAFIGENPNLL